MKNILCVLGLLIFTNTALSDVLSVQSTVAVDCARPKTEPQQHLLKIALPDELLFLTASNYTIRPLSIEVNNSKISNSVYGAGKNSLRLVTQNFQLSTGVLQNEIQVRLWAEDRDLCQSNSKTNLAYEIKDSLDQILPIFVVKLIPGTEQKTTWIENSRQAAIKLIENKYANSLKFFLSADFEWDNSEDMIRFLFRGLIYRDPKCQNWFCSGKSLEDEGQSLYQKLIGFFESLNPMLIPDTSRFPHVLSENFFKSFSIDQHVLRIYFDSNNFIDLEPAGIYDKFRQDLVPRRLFRNNVQL